MTEITSGEGRGTGNICQDILQHRSQEAHPIKNNDQHWVKGIPRNWTMIHENIPFKCGTHNEYIHIKRNCPKKPALKSYNNGFKNPSDSKKASQPPKTTIKTQNRF